MTPSPTPTEAEKVVAEWRAAMEGVTPGPWSFSGLKVFFRRVEAVIARCRFSEGYLPLLEEAAEKNAAWIARCSPSGISGLLALIERLAKENAALSSGVSEIAGQMELIESQRATGTDHTRSGAELEARVTALVRDLTSVKQQCETAVYNISQREHDEAVVRSFQNIADFSAQALSRSSTEVKNDG